MYFNLIRTEIIFIEQIYIILTLWGMITLTLVRYLKYLLLCVL